MWENRGFTLLEVLLALVIIGIMTGIILQVYIGEYKASTDFNKRTEMRYALLRANQVLDQALRSATEVTYEADKGLAVTPADLEGTGSSCDQYYVADLDGDGTTDLYRKHLGVSNPVVTGITAINCAHIGRGLWEMTIQAADKETVYTSRQLIRQRIDLVEQEAATR